MAETLHPRTPVVTGIGCYGNMGTSTVECWEGVKAGRTAIRLLPEGLRIRTFVDGDGMSKELLMHDVSVAASAPEIDPKDLAAATGIEYKRARNSGKAVRLLLMACLEATGQAGIRSQTGLQLADYVDRRRVGVYTSTGVGAPEEFVEVERGFREGSRPKPSKLLITLPDRAVSVPAIAMGAQGKAVASTAACATGNASIIAGAKDILHGYRDFAVVGGAEAQVNSHMIAMFDSAGALDQSTDPSDASRPYDIRGTQGKGGFVMGEGAAVYVLESYESARRRGAEVLAAIRGFGESCDAHHDTEPAEDGHGVASAIQEAISGIQEYECVYVNTHGTGTKGDAAELRGVQRVFNPRQVGGIGSLKSYGAHWFGGAAAWEGAMGVMAMREGVIPVNLRIGEIIPEAQGWPVYTMESPQREGYGVRAPIDLVVKISIGFGGINEVVTYGPEPSRENR